MNIKSDIHLHRFGLWSVHLWPSKHNCLIISCSFSLRPANSATAFKTNPYPELRSMRWTRWDSPDFKSNLKDVIEAHRHHKHNTEEHLFLDGTLPLLPVCLLWRLATHWWGIRKSLRNTNSRMAQSQPTPDLIYVFIYRLVGKNKL